MTCRQPSLPIFHPMVFSKTVKSFPHALAFLFFFLLLCCQPALAQKSSSKQFKSRAAALIQDFENQYKGKVAISTMVLKSGKIPYSRNGTTPMVPASNLKLITTAVALDKLGPKFRFKTVLWAPKRQVDGVAQGNLVLQGGGDPCFYAPVLGSSLEPFKNFAKAITSRGLKGFSGNLLVDATVFDTEYISSTYHDRYLLDDYAAPVGGLSLNRNRVTLNVTTDSVRTKPNSGAFKFVNKVEPGSRNQIWVERPRGTDTVTIHGVVKPGATAQTTITVGNPVRFAGSAFYRVLKKSGIRIHRWKMVKARSKEWDPRQMVRLATHESPNLASMISDTNVDSDNLLAQHIFRKLGAQAVNAGTVAAGEAVVRDFFRKHNIPSEGLKMYDGSGLSDKNKITPSQIVRTLLAMWGHDRGQIFIDSLPAPGEGTLRRRLRGKVVRAKTGTLKDHSGLSGYVVTAYGETVGFSILVNDVPEVWRAVELQNKLVHLIASWDRAL